LQEIADITTKDAAPPDKSPAFNLPPLAAANAPVRALRFLIWALIVNKSNQ
jgi:hypothetical protein